MASRPSSTPSSSNTWESMSRMASSTRDWRASSSMSSPLKVMRRRNCAESPAVATQQGQAQTARHAQCGAGIDVGIAVPVPTRPEPRENTSGCRFEGHPVDAATRRASCRQGLEEHMLEVPASGGLPPRTASEPGSGKTASSPSWCSSLWAASRSPASILFRQVGENAQRRAGIELGRMGRQHDADMLAGHRLRRAPHRARVGKSGATGLQGLRAPSRSFKRSYRASSRASTNTHLPLDILGHTGTQAQALLLRADELLPNAPREIHRRPPFRQAFPTSFSEERHAQSRSPNAVQRQGQKDAVVDFKGARQPPTRRSECSMGLIKDG